MKLKAICLSGVILSLVTPSCFALTCEYSKYPDDSILQIDLTALAADKMRGRKLGENQLAQNYLISRYKQIGLLGFNPSYKQSFLHQYAIGKTEGNNIVGWLQGTDFKEQFLVITAHYDHLGVQMHDNFNGADDNASGTAALLFLAEYFSRYHPRHSIIFVATDGEEKGLLGARAFVSQPPVALGNIKLNVNIDMIGGSGENPMLYVAGERYSPALSHIIRRATLLPCVSMQTGHEGLSRSYDKRKRIHWLKASDHYAFYRQHIPFLYFGTNDHRFYHTPEDTPDNIDQPFFHTAVISILMTILSWDNPAQ
ncbi:M28 family peptidase [Neptunicella marina]|uniref:M28 family peptidase n=1 Tax=Neptunicella marina TaxID=2125989 RepID=A0A8J6ITK5_9ALTE|nr:M28 family peptidase [Neptunicella marina]MBC3765371.1 M28 family peptidase [Neptunicella marina]